MQHLQSRHYLTGKYHFSKKYAQNAYRCKVDFASDRSNANEVNPSMGWARCVQNLFTQHQQHVSNLQQVLILKTIKGHPKMANFVKHDTSHVRACQCCAECFNVCQSCFCTVECSFVQKQINVLWYNAYQIVPPLQVSIFVQYKFWWNVLVFFKVTISHFCRTASISKWFLLNTSGFQHENHSYFYETLSYIVKGLQILLVSCGWRYVLWISLFMHMGESVIMN